MISHQQPYSIKRHGTNINDCDKEPVQTPGCIQPHGVLLVLRQSDLSILQVSENSTKWLGLPPEQLLRNTVDEIWTSALTKALRDFLEGEIVERNPLYFTTFTPRHVPELRLDVTVHTLNGVIVIECERTQRDSAGKPVAEPDYYSLVKKTLTRFQNAPGLQEFCQTLSEEVRRITGLDRVMVYRFHPDASGEVFAEARDEKLDPWLGFRYPAHDIPKPAREVFKRIWIRPVPDIKAELAEMVPLTNPDNLRPLEMTHCTLRGASVMYTEYLQNMGVGAALTMSLKKDGELWGLIACHHYSPTSFSYQMRAACEFVAQAASLQLKNAEDREHLHYRSHLDAIHYTALSRAATKGELSVLVQEEPTLTEGIESTGAAVFHRGTWFSTGRTPSIQALDRLAEWLREQTNIFNVGSRNVFATDHLVGHFPGAASFADVGSGLLAVPISSNGKSLILWFRPETIQTFTWGGNPNDLPLVAGPNGPRLTPRKSFELWRETVRQRSVPWKNVEIDAAAKLRLLVMDLVVSRADQLSDLNAELSRSNEELNAFAYVASHDLKEPLRGIHKYASQLLAEAEAGKIQGEQNLERLHSLQRLTTRMDDLINSLLHFSRVGHSKLEFELIDLNALVRESQEMLGVFLHEHKVQVTLPRPMPSIQCDRIRVREIFSNLISNGVKYNQSESKIIEVGYLDAAEVRSMFETESAPPHVLKQRIFYVKDNGIGIDKKHYGQVFRIFKRLHVRDAFGGGSGAGLAIVKKLVEQHGGDIWLESKVGSGTTFYFTLQGEQEA